MNALGRAVLGRRLVVCVGAGGVGKTTTAAALGLWAAGEGRRVLVLTIDPARRLANAMGLSDFGNARVRVELPREVPGELWGMMLDTRSTFIDLIRRLAPDDDTRDRILANPIFRVMTDAFASTQEYMATEQLHEVLASRAFDLVVLDTPPVKNALDFLDAPGRLARFFDPQILRWYLKPYDERRVFGRLFAGTSAVVFRLLGFLFGREFLGQLSEFLRLFEHMYEGFRARHLHVEETFRASTTGFLTVTALHRPAVEVAGYFAEQFADRRLPHLGTVVNQVHPCRHGPLDPVALLGEDAERVLADLPPATDARLLARLGQAHRRLRDVAGLERELLELLQARRAPGPLVRVPRLEREIHDLDGLARMARALCEADPGAPPPPPGG